MPYASAGFLAVMGTLVMTDMAAGLLRLRELTASLEQQVQERERRLSDIYDQRLVHERSAAVTQERERLLADMHDSLGAGLSTTQLLLRQGHLSTQDAAHMVQECIDDLRLVFDVSANLEQDLHSLVVDVRYRLESRLAAVGLQTQWTLALDGMPTLGSSDCLQLMRIVQEALSNAMRHARARHIQVSLQWFASDRQLLLRVCDDGVGIPIPSPATGRGLANMARRAHALGAELDVRGAHPGTEVELRLSL